MPNIGNLSIGALVFLAGAILYVINVVLALAKKRPLAVDGVGLMVLGIGLVLVLKW
jgi:hypothetical protein